MQLQISARSHVGKVRKKNEDNFCVLDMILPEEKTENYQWSTRTRLKKPVFLGVFDGMGGYSKGERASFLMARIACRMAGETEGASASQLLTDICMTSNLAVCQEMRGPEGCQMGTTAAMLLFDKRKYTLCNVGDSPIFRFRAGRLEEIHQEHTERATYESVTGKPAPAGKKFRLTQNIGMFPEEITIEPYCAEGDLNIGDIYLICSDGITDMVPPAKMMEILLANKTTEAIAQSLEEEALAAGGKDNATVVCIRVVRGL